MLLYAVTVGGGGGASGPTVGGRGINGVNSTLNIMVEPLPPQVEVPGGGHESGIKWNPGGSGGGATNDNTGKLSCITIKSRIRLVVMVQPSILTVVVAVVASVLLVACPTHVVEMVETDYRLQSAGPGSDTTGVGKLNPGPGQYQWFSGGGGRIRTYGTAGVGGGGITWTITTKYYHLSIWTRLELVVVEVAPDPPTTMNEVVMVDLALLL